MKKGGIKSSDQKPSSSNDLPVNDLNASIDDPIEDELYLKLLGSFGEKGVFFKEFKGKCLNLFICGLIYSVWISLNLFCNLFFFFRCI